MQLFGLTYIKGLLVERRMGLLATMFTCAFKINCYFFQFNQGQHALQNGHSGNRLAAVGKMENEPADPDFYL